MASVYKRGTKWIVMYRYETPTGERKQKKVSGFATKEEAWAAARTLEQKSNAGIEVNGDAMTCGELMERWFADRSAGLAETTAAKYSGAMDKLCDTFIVDTKIRRLNQQLFNQLINQLLEGNIAVRTAVSYTEPLRLSLSWAAKAGMIPLNPLASVTLPKAPKRLQQILSNDDIDDLVAASVSPRRRCTDFRIPLLLALYGGLRREECAGLRWESVDFKARTVTICEAVTMTPDGKEHIKDTKTSCSNRTVSMPKWVMDELADAYSRFLKRPKEHTMRHNPRHRVCVSSTGDPYSCKSYAHALLRLIREINDGRDVQNLPLMPEASFHDLRHTHAAMCIRLGIQPKVISERLGHASIKITMDTYGYLMPGLQQSVADAFDQEHDQKQPPLSAAQ